MIEAEVYDTPSSITEIKQRISSAAHTMNGLHMHNNTDVYIHQKFQKYFADITFTFSGEQSLKVKAVLTEKIVLNLSLKRDYIGHVSFTDNKSYQRFTFSMTNIPLEEFPEVHGAYVKYTEAKRRSYSNAEAVIKRAEKGGEEYLKSLMISNIEYLSLDHEIKEVEDEIAALQLSLVEKIKEINEVKQKIKKELDDSIASDINEGLERLGLSIDKIKDVAEAEAILHPIEPILEYKTKTILKGLE